MVEVEPVSLDITEAFRRSCCCLSLAGIYERVEEGPRRPFPLLSSVKKPSSSSASKKSISSC
jgi:hypothetical protein